MKVEREKLKKEDQRPSYCNQLGLLLLLFLILYTAASFAGDDSIRLLQQAYEHGELSYQAALNYKLEAVFNKKKLPLKYQSDMPVKSATSIILEARQNRALISKNNQFILFRPTDGGDDDYYGAGIAVWTYDSEGGHFKIHYTEDNSNGDAVFGFDGDQFTVPQYVIDLAGYLDDSWTGIITDMGYAAPPSDGAAGGDDRVDVYLVDMNAYGYTSFESGPSDVYIVLENDFTGFPENLDPDHRQGAQKVTAVHEFFHTSQLTYTTNLSANMWWMEAASTWVEDVIFPEVKDYLNYAGFKFDDLNDNGLWDSGETWYEIDGVTEAGVTGRPERWFDSPESSLNSTAGSHEYGTIMFIKYLSKTYDDAAIKSIWDRIRDGATALNAISNELISWGTSLGDAFVSFQSANYRRDYPDGDYYPFIRHEGTYTSFPLNITGAVNHLSSHFYAFKPGDTASDIVFTFNNMQSGNLAVKLILTRTSGLFDEQDMVLDGASVSHQVAGVSTSYEYSKVVMIVMNTSPSRDGEAYSVSTNMRDSSGEEDGGGCFIATAAYGSYLAEEVRVLRRFRDEHLMTNPAGSAFVRYYYEFSPSVADYIKSHAVLKMAVRYMLTPVVYSVKYPARALFIICFLIAMSIFLINWKRVRSWGRC